MSEYVIPATGNNVAMNAGAASSSTQRLVTASDSPEVVSLASIDGKTPALGQALAAASVPTVLPALTEGLFGALTETAPATDTASSGLNGRLQRVAQRITSLIALLPASLGGKARASSYAVTLSDEEQLLIGSAVESAPATDTASSGLNGRLQRIAQRLTAMFGTAGSASTTVLSVQGIASGTSLSVTSSGSVAHDGVDSGNPVKVGAIATASLNGGTNVAAADRTDLKAALDGALLVRDGSLEDLVTATPIAITDGSSTSLIAAQGAGVKTYITDLTISNTSASNVEVDIRDGAAGSVKWTCPVPAYGGYTHHFRKPLPFSADTAVCADPSAAATTIKVSANGFKSKI